MRRFPVPAQGETHSIPFDRTGVLVLSVLLCRGTKVTKASNDDELPWSRQQSVWALPRARGFWGALTGGMCRAGTLHACW